MATDNTEKKTHPWRPCPNGMHYVKTHQVTYPPSAAHPNGHTGLRLAHCAANPVRSSKQSTKASTKQKVEKDILPFNEVEYISDLLPEFIGQKTLPSLPKFTGSDKYDLLILGWVQYWNDIFQAEEPLDPKLIKALMASESSFRENPPVVGVAKNKKNQANGLLQVTNETLQILNDPKGELKNYLLKINSNQLLIPSANICAGVRWLFHKKKLATHRLKREATWMEAVAEYKSYLKDMIADENLEPSGMENVLDNYSLLQDTT